MQQRMMQMQMMQEQGMCAPFFFNYQSALRTCVLQQQQQQSLFYSPGTPSCLAV